MPGSPSSVVMSWKPVGSIRVLFPCKEGQSNALECTLSTACAADLQYHHPKTLTSVRMVSSTTCIRQQHEQGEFWLQSRDDSNLHMGTVNALLLNVRGSLLLADPTEDSSRQFLYCPRSLHTASLTEYHPSSSLMTTRTTTTTTTTPSSPKRKFRAPVEKKSPLVQANSNDDDIIHPVMTVVVPKNNNEPEQVVVTPVTLLELRQLYQECLETGMPGPLDVLRKVQVSVNDGNVKQCMDLLVTNNEWLAHDPNDCRRRRLLELQVGIRLALSASCRTFCNLHHELVVCQKRSTLKKRRQQRKKQTPQQALEQQLLNLFSLLAIQSDTPTNFQSSVRELVTTTCAPQDTVNVIYDFFELHDDDEDEEASTVAVVPKTEPKPMTLVPQNDDDEEEEPTIISAKENSLIGQSLSLTASIRTNKLVPDQKRKYVGSHFNTKLSNVSALFRQVTVPVPKIRSKETKKVEEERPVKKPRVAFCYPPPPPKQQVVSETPAKRYSQTTGTTLSPMGPDSQNAFLVAQEALAARRGR